MFPAALYQQQSPPPSNVQPPQQQYSSWAPPPNRRSILPILLLLVLVAVAGGAVALIVIGGYNLDDLELRVRGKTYNAASFDIRYPQDWHPITTNQPDTAMFATTNQLGERIERGEPVESLGSGEAVVSFTSSSADPQTVSQSAGQVATQFDSSAQVQITGVEEKDIGPHEATETTFTAATQSGAQIDGLVIVVIVDDTPFIVEGLAAPGEIDDFQSMIEAMIRSLEVDSGGTSSASSGSGGANGASGASGSGRIPDDNELIGVGLGWINAVNTGNTNSALSLIHPNSNWLNPREYIEEDHYPYNITITPLQSTVQDKSADAAVVAIRVERRGTNPGLGLSYPDHIMTYIFELKPDGDTWKLDFIREDVNNFQDKLLDDTECAPNCY